MNRGKHHLTGHAEHGVTMLEVLITIVILAFGLLGVAGLQSRLQLAEIEAYQRAQAVVLLQEMVDRLNANRKNSIAYAGTTVGTGSNGGLVQDCTGKTGADLDLCEWHNALLGASEETSGGVQIGAMIGARGCITNPTVTAVLPRDFLVAVAWQGVTPTLAPTSTTCGQGAYGDEATRRAVVARVTIGCLQNDAATGLCVTP